VVGLDAFPTAAAHVDTESAPADDESRQHQTREVTPDTAPGEPASSRPRATETMRFRVPWS